MSWNKNKNKNELFRRTATGSTGIILDLKGVDGDRFIALHTCAPNPSVKTEMETHQWRLVLATWSYYQPNISAIVRPAAGACL